MSTIDVRAVIEREQEKLRQRASNLSQLLKWYNADLRPPEMLRLLRTYAGLTQDELSRLICSSRSTIVQLESGACTNSEIYDKAIDAIATTGIKYES